MQKLLSGLLQARRILRNGSCSLFLLALWCSATMLQRQNDPATASHGPACVIITIRPRLTSVTVCACVDCAVLCMLVWVNF